MRTGLWTAGLLAGAAALLSAPALADDLREALVAAYNTNPTLQGARAQQRAIDEDVPIAKAQGRPSLDGSTQFVENIKQSSNSFSSPRRALGAGVDLGVPLYAGGAIRNSIRAAETRVGAGQADLRATESSVFSQVVAAYMDVIRDESIVGLNANNVEVLTVNVEATRDRFEIGDLTRTDVAQSEARLALARGDLRTAQANLIASRERYIELVGDEPGDLAPPPPLPNLPGTPGEAVAVALNDNPDLVAARERSRASGFDVRVAGASRLPRLSVFTGGDYSNFLGSLPDRALTDSIGNPQTNPMTGQPIILTSPQTSTSASIGLSASIPLYQGGEPAARERQAQARRSVALESEIAVERDVIAQVRSAFSSLQAANEIIATNQTAVEAAALSLEGVRAENTVGNRSILDILDAEQELLRAQVQLVTARRNAYVAGFSLLAAMGLGEARDLGLDGGPLYDPEVNYRRVRNKWNDWARDPHPQPQSTRTVDTPAQDAAIPQQMETMGPADPLRAMRP